MEQPPLKYGVPLVTADEAQPPENFAFEVVRSFEDGDYLFLQVAKTHSDGKRWVSVSLVDQSDGSRAQVPIQITTPVRRRRNDDESMVGGDREIKDLDQTQANKALVLDFIQAMFIDEAYARAAEQVDIEHFVSHSPLIRMSWADFTQTVERMISETSELVFEQVITVIGSGNFVAMFARITCNGLAHHVCDLFRLEAGRIVEHWDVVEPIVHLPTASND